MISRSSLAISSLQGLRGLPARPVEDPSGRDFSAKEKQGEVVVYARLNVVVAPSLFKYFLIKDKIKPKKIRDKAVVAG
jgi:hypothetical protein